MWPSPGWSRVFISKGNIDHGKGCGICVLWCPCNTIEIITENDWGNSRTALAVLRGRVAAVDLSQVPTLQTRLGLALGQA
jgi:NAD-dependent dihydropyrimidine dehydrogenase PreA subunit